MAKIKEMTTVENKPKTLEELTKERDAFEKEVNKVQEKLAKAKYTVDFDSVANISKVLKHIDKSCKWTIKDAALVLNLYDNIKIEKARIKAEEEKGAKIMLNSIDLNSLYKSFASFEGIGMVDARSFITLLTNIGSQISDAMENMATANKEIQNMHIQLAELDKAIDEMSTEKVEADEIVE
jgi:hypothetical protein